MQEPVRINSELTRSGCLSFIRFRLSRITAPTLVIWGREDQTIPVAQAEVARKGIPNVEVHIFDKCAHVPMIENPAAFNELVLKVLRSGAVFIARAR